MITPATWFVAIVGSLAAWVGLVYAVLRALAGGMA